MLSLLETHDRGAALTSRLRAATEASGREWKARLTALAIAFALLEVVSAVFIEAPGVAIVFAILFVLAALGLRFWTAEGAVLLGLLFLIELLGLPFYPRDGVEDWIIQSLELLLSVAGLIAAVAVLRQRR